MNNIKNNVTNTIILSAGRGSRMRYKTNFIAKPLIRLQNKVILEVNLHYLSSFGIKKCVINTSYKHKSIENFINNYSYKNKYPNIITSFEKTRLETGGGIKKALKYFNSSNILAINGDSLLISDSNSCPVKKLCENFDKDKMDILLLLCPIKNCIGYSGKGDYSKGAIKNASIIKRKVANSEEAYVFTGWQIIKKKLIEKTKLKSFSLNIIFDRVEKNKKLYGIIFEGNFLHISTPKSILQIENYLSKYKISL